MTASQWSALAATAARPIHEIRLHFCQTSPNSQGLRSFIQSQYAAMKKTNPLMPILVRECRGVQSRAFIQFGGGAEQKVVLDGLTEAQVHASLQQALHAKA